MALKLELTSERPGYGRLVIRNLAAEGELQFSFQRASDHHYLGPSRQWQPTAHWHVVGGVVTDGNDCSSQLGPDIIDGLLLSSSDSMRVSVQGGGSSDQGSMRIIGRLLGSNAAGSSPERVSMSRADDGSADAETVPEVPETVEEAPTSTETPPQPPSPQPSTPLTGSSAGSGKRWLWILLAVLVLLAALSAVWYFDLLKLPGLPGDGGSAAPDITEDTVAVDNEPDTMASTLKGRPRAQAYLVADERPEPQAMFDQAAVWESEGDCEAAMIVYQMAAQTDTDQAARYARRYDPESFEASSCISGADAETAAYWYEGPAGAGDVEAQRQLGKLLVGKYSSGVLREQGESWLRRAAQNGDRDAQALIEKLGISDN